MELGTWGDWAGAIATTFTGFVALLVVFWQEHLRSLFFRPKVTVECGIENGSDLVECYLGPSRQKALFVRLRVRNNGKDALRKLSAQIFELLVADPAGRAKSSPLGFVPVRIK